MAGSGGFEPQSKPPVHTGGFDFVSKRVKGSHIHFDRVKKRKRGYSYGTSNC